MLLMTSYLVTIETDCRQTKMFLQDMLIINAVEEIGEKPLGEWHPPRPLVRPRLKLKKYKIKVLNSKSVKVAYESHFWQIKVT